MSRCDALTERTARREGRVNWQYAWIPSMRQFEETRQTASLPHSFRRRK